jgi:hypothetical protein
LCTSGTSGTAGGMAAMHEAKPTIIKLTTAEVLRAEAIAVRQHAVEVAQSGGGSDGELANLEAALLQQRAESAAAQAAVVQARREQARAAEAAFAQARAEVRAARSSLRQPAAACRAPRACVPD